MWDTLYVQSPCSTYKIKRFAASIVYSPKIWILYLEDQSPKFKRVSLNETLEFPFWGLNIL